MPSVDDRVVQLRFENAQFEKGVSTSMNTLDKLDSKLKSGVSGTALLALGNAAEEVSKRFSVMEVAGITAVSNLANRVVNAATNIVSAVPKQIISGGKTRALNIEQAKFQLSGLNVLWEDIYDNIDKAVSGTAYGLDEAAKVASQLVASGVEYGSATSDMAHALRGISGVAAMTNSSYEEIGSIFTTVAGQGKLMTMQLRQLEARGLNVAAKLGEQLGKSEEQIRDMVTKGKINFLTFANAMDEAFGEHATKANETFTGALSNMKAALSRIGADFATPILDRSRDVFNALRLMFNGIRGLTRPFAETAFTDVFGKMVDSVTGMITKVSDRINGFVSSRPYKLFTKFFSKDSYELPTIKYGDANKNVEAIQWFLKRASNGVIDWTPDGIFGKNTEQAVKDFQRINGLVETGVMDLDTWVALFGETKEELTSTIHSELPNLFYGTANDSVTTLQNLLTELHLWDKETDGVFGQYTEQAIKDFQKMNGLAETGIVNLDTWAALLGETKEDLLSALHIELPDLFYGSSGDKVRELQNKLTELGLWEYQADGVFGQHTRDAIIAFQENNGLIANGIVNLETWAALLGKSKQELIDEYDAEVAPMTRIIQTVSSVVDALKKIGINLKTAFGVIGKAAGRAWKTIFPNAVGNIIQTITTLIENFSNRLVELTKRFRFFAASNSNKFQRAFSGLFAILSIGKQVIEGLGQGLRRLLSPLTTIAGSLGGKIGKVVLDFAARIGDVLVKFNDFAKGTNFFGEKFEALADWILSAKDAIVLFFGELGNRLSQSEQFQSFVSRWQEFVQLIQGLGSHVWERLVGLWGQLNEQAEKLGLTLPEIAAGGLMEGLLSALDWLFDKLTKIIDFISPAIDWISTKLDGLFTILGSINLSNLINGQGPLFGISFSEVFGTPTEIVNNFLNNVIGLFGKTRETVGPVVRSIIDGITGFVSGLDALSPVVETVTGVVDGAKETFDDVSGAIETVTSTVDTVKDTVSQVTETVAPVVDSVKSAGETITDTATQVGETIAPIVDGAKEAGDAIGRMAGGTQRLFAPTRGAADQRRRIVRDIDDTAEAAEGATVVAELASEAIGDLGDTTKKSGNNILSGLDKILPAIPIIGTLYSAFKGIKNVAGSDTVKNSGIVSSISSWVESGGLLDSLLSIWNWVKRVGGNFFEFIASMDHGEIYAIISGIGTLLVLKKLTGVFKSVSGIFTAASNVITGLSRSVENIVASITGTMNNALKTVRRAQTAKILVALALVIGVIIGSIWLISTIPSEKIWTAVAIVGVVALYVAIMAGVLTSMAKNAKATSDYKGVAAIILGLGLSILAIAGAIKLLDDVQLSWELGGKLLILAAIVTGMIFAVKALAKSRAKTIQSGIAYAIMMLAFAGAVALLAKALEYVAKADFSGMGDNFAIIVIALGMMALVAKSAGNKGLTNALGLTIMIADIWLLVLALQSLAKVNSAQLMQALPAFIIVLGAMTAMMAATRLAGEHAAGAGVGILLISASLLIVARAVKKLSQINIDQLDGALTVIRQVLLMYALIIAASQYAKGGALLSAGVAFILIAVSINLLYFAIKNFAKLADESESFDKAAHTVEIFLAAFAAIEGLSGIAKPGKLIVSVIGFAMLLAAIVGVFTFLKNAGISGNEMQTQANVIVELLGALIIVSACIAAIGHREGVVKDVAKGILVVDIVIADLVALIGLIGFIATKVGGIGLISNGVKILSLIGDCLNKYGITFGIVIAAFVGLSYVLGMLINSGLGVALGEGFAAALVIVDVLMINLEALFGAIGEIANKFGTDVIETGISVVESIGEGIGRFFGAISGEFDKAKMERQGEGVEALSESLNNSTDGLTAFTDAVNSLDTTKVNDVSSLASAVETMSAAAEAYSPELGQTFSRALRTYGAAASDFFTLMENSGVDAYKAAKFAEAISSLSSIAVYGDSTTFDADTFKTFMEELRWYIGSIITLLTIINKDDFVIDQSKIDTIVQMGTDLASIYDSIPETGGIVQKFFGEESLTTFAGDITRYVSAMRIVNDVISGFEPDTDAWGFFVDIAGKFSELLDGIGYIFIEGNTAADQNKMSALAGFIGSTSLETFANDLANYVKGIIAVNDVLVGLTNETFYAGTGVGYLTKEKDYEWSDAWDMLVEVGQKMSEVYKSLPGYLPEEDGGFLSRITNFLTRNKDGLSTFGEDLGDYVKAIVGVNDDIIAAGLTPETMRIDALDVVAQVAKDWSSIATDLADVDTSKIKSLGLALGGADNGFMLGFSNFYDTVSIMDMSLIESAIEDMKQIVLSLSELASTDTTGIGDLSTVSSALGDLGDTFAVAFATSFAQNAGALIEIGTNITASISEGILENSEELGTAVGTVSADGATAATDRVGLYELAGIFLVSAMAKSMGLFGTQFYTTGYALAGQAASGAAGRYTAFWYAGYYMAQGIIKGIKWQYGALYNAGVGMANQALKGVTDTAVINSPSEITTQYGLYLGQGLANGLINSKGTVATAAEGMTNSMLSSLNSVVSYVYDILSGALDYDMTIRPVLDLSNVRAGAQELNGMFDTGRYTLGSSMYVPKVSVGNLQTEDKTSSATSSIINNFYVQRMDEGQIDYFVNRINTELGARV